MADDNPETLAWDRVGRFLEDSSATAQEIAQRNLTLWSSLSKRLRSEEGYDADAMAQGVADSMVSAMDSLDDVWGLVGRSRMDDRGDRIPTIFLLFGAAEDGMHTLPSPTSIRISERIRSNDLPESPALWLSARHPAYHVTPRPSSSRDGRLYASPDSVDELSKYLVVSLQDKSHAYLLGTLNPAGGQGERPPTATNLTPGVYDGLLYLTNPAVALAELRIVVEPH